MLQARVFEPFFKIDNARHKENVGFRLGLSIMADIVHSHRGTMLPLYAQCLADHHGLKSVPGSLSRNRM